MMNSDSCSDLDSNLVIVTSAQPDTTVDSKIQFNPVVKSEGQSEGDNLYSDDVIDSLWTARVMGRHGPEEILISLWYFISHFFGISSRTDHAKLCLGNIIIDSDGDSTKKLIFNKNFSLSGKDKSEFTTRFTPRPIYELINNRDRCPVTIFEEYLIHRPPNFSYPSSPFYLQPDKSHNFIGPWFSAGALGKNRIGSLFNCALSRCGQPTIRHYNSRRQIIGDASKVTQSLSPTPPSIKPTVDNSSLKIKLKISHLSSGNPTVTQTLLQDDCGNKGAKSSNIAIVENKAIINRKKSGGLRKRGLEEIKDEPTININSITNDQKDDLSENDNVKKEKLDIVAFQDNSDNNNNNNNNKTNVDNKAIKKCNTAVKSVKRILTVQKSIINITKTETSPIIRQIMMQLCMNKDFLTPSDNNKGNSNSSKSRLLRRTVKLNHLQLPLWPTIDTFCDSELQRSMRYSFDDDNNNNNNNNNFDNIDDEGEGDVADVVE